MHPTELEYFKEFVSLYEFPFNIDQWKDNRKEVPNFLVYHGKYTLGIELIEAFKNPEPDAKSRTRQAIENEWYNICDSAKKIWDNFDLPNVSVEINFDDNQFHDKKINSEKIAREIAEVIRDSLPKKNDIVNIHSENFDQQYLPEEVIWLTITHNEDYPSSNLYFNDGGNIPELKRSHIDIILQKKDDQKVISYLNNCDEIWLLVVIDGWRHSSFLDIPEKLLQIKFKSKFEKVLLFHTLRKTIHELKLEPQTK